MDFNYKNNSVTLTSEKKSIILNEDSVNLDGLIIDCAGEYEKSGFLMYARTSAEITYYYFRVENLWIGYIPTIPTEIEPAIAEFFGQLDILIAPFSKNEKNFLEQIEPKMLISFSNTGSDLVPVLGECVSNSHSYKLKLQDISSEKTALVLLSE